MAVYTQVSDEALAAFLTEYDLGAPLSFKGIAEGVENSNYYLETEKGRYILTLFEKRVNAAELPYFVGLKQHLASKGYPCPSPIAARDERIRKALQLANLQPEETLYDLGSGHGRVLVIAAREFGANAVGIEIGPVQCVIARINALLNGVSSKVRVEAGNFYKADVSRADVVYAYLTSKQAPRLQAQLEKQLKPGARVVTISFSFPNWKPVMMDRDDLIFFHRMPPEPSA